MISEGSRVTRKSVTKVIKYWFPESLVKFLKKIKDKRVAYRDRRLATAHLKKRKTDFQRKKSASERVLVCILGQTRAYRLTWPNFQKNVLKELDADLALCIGVDDAYDYSNPFWRHAQYRWTVREFDDYGAGFDQAQRALISKVGEMPNWRRLLRIEGQWLGGVKGDGAQLGSGAIQIYFRWRLLQNIERERLLESYDRFVVTRSDFMWDIPHPPLSILSQKYLWIPNGEHYGGLTDRHMLVARNELRDSLNLIDDIVLRPEQLLELMANRSPWNIEKYILFHFKRYGIGDRVRLCPYVSYTVRDATDSTRWAVGTYNPELGMMVKYCDELVISRTFENRIKTREDWEVLARMQPSLFSFGLK